MEFPVPVTGAGAMEPRAQRTLTLCPADTSRTAPPELSLRRGLVISSLPYRYRVMISGPISAIGSTVESHGM